MNSINREATKFEATKNYLRECIVDITTEMYGLQNPADERKLTFYMDVIEECKQAISILEKAECE